MIRLFNLYKITVLGCIVGALGGFAYYYFVGCESGSCSITSSPVNSSVYGFLMGGLLFNLIESQFKTKKDGK